MNGFHRTLGPALLAVLSACSSSESTGPVSVTLSGAVLDYFTGSAVSDVGVAVDPASPTGSTSANGSYVIQGVASSEALVLVTSKTGYRPTRNPALSATSGTVTADLSVVAVPDVQRQYTAVSLVATAGTAVVFIDLVDGSGTARTGVVSADITLVGGAQSPVGAGPYFFGAAGDIVPLTDVSQSTAFGGRARAAFLNVPSGMHTLRVAVGGQTLIAPVVTSAGGATLVER
jgi:hypothetical protein